MKLGTVGMLVLLLSVAAPAVAQDSNAFFTIVNTYAFTTAPRQGERILLRARKTYSVVGQTLDADEVVWYQVIDPQRRIKIKGTGWVPLDPHELNEIGDQPVSVFPVVLENGDVPIEALEIPATDLELANVAQPSESFAGITWQKVNYETDRPAHLWVRSTTGIYRPFKSDKFLSEAYAEMLTLGVLTDRLRRLLSGVVRVGDSPDEVKWALGIPTQEEESTAEELQITIWHYPGRQVRFENQVVKQIK